MRHILVLLSIVAAAFLISWLIGLIHKSARQIGGELEQQARDDRAVSARRRLLSGSRRRPLDLEEGFPRYNPSRNDEAIWRAEVETKFRQHPGYPPDWERRRVLVFLRDDGKCRNCGRPCGHLLCEPDQIWGFDYDEKLVVDAHIHHAKNLASGGDHSLANLSLLCPRCHVRKHPKNSGLLAGVVTQFMGGGRRGNRYRKYYRRKAPKPPEEDVPF